jgi:hypothetical protein
VKEETQGRVHTRVEARGKRKRGSKEGTRRDVGPGARQGAWRGRRAVLTLSCSHMYASRSCRVATGLTARKTGEIKEAERRACGVGA